MSESQKKDSAPSSPAAAAKPDEPVPSTSPVIAPKDDSAALPGTTPVAAPKPEEPVVGVTPAAGEAAGGSQPSAERAVLADVPQTTPVAGGSAEKPAVTPVAAPEAAAAE